MSKFSHDADNIKAIAIPQVFSENSQVNPFPNDKFYTLPNQKNLQTTISKMMKIAESSPNG